MLSLGQGAEAFGSVTTADIAALINEKSKLNIDRHQLVLESPIKTLGSYDIPVKLHPSVEASVTVRSSPQTAPQVAVKRGHLTKIERRLRIENSDSQRIALRKSGGLLT